MKKVLFASGALAVVVLRTFPNYAQAQTATATTLKFEVASVRAMGAIPRSAYGRMNGGPGSSDPETMTYSRVAMMRLLRDAFNVSSDQIAGPSWLMDANSDGALRFEIQAKVRPGATQKQVQEMLRNLLIERFGLKFQVQQKMFDGYNLVVAPGGAKLTAAEASDVAAVGKIGQGPIPLDSDGFPQVPAGFGKIVTTGNTPDGAVRLVGRGVSAEQIAAVLGLNLVNPHVLDKTGLAGNYDFRLEFASNQFDPASSKPVPDLATAMEKQLGLKLERVKAPLDFIVVDQIAKEPSEN